MISDPSRGGDGTLIPFGLHANGRMVTAREVTRGAACDCFCPKCQEPLIAKKGDEVVHYFAHSTDIECKGARETALHRFAKQIICDERRLTLPSVFAIVANQIVLIHQSLEISFSRSDQEASIEELRTDVLATMPNGQQVAIEIYVAHRVPPEKIQRLRELGVDAIEINISGMTRDFDVDSIREEVLHKARRFWLFHSVAELATRELNRVQSAVASAERTVTEIADLKSALTRHSSRAEQSVSELAWEVGRPKREAEARQRILLEQQRVDAEREKRWSEAGPKIRDLVQAWRAALVHPDNDQSFGVPPFHSGWIEALTWAVFDEFGGSFDLAQGVSWLRQNHLIQRGLGGFISKQDEAAIAQFIPYFVTPFSALFHLAMDSGLSPFVRYGDRQWVLSTRARVEMEERKARLAAVRETEVDVPHRLFQQSISIPIESCLRVSRMRPSSWTGKRAYPSPGIFCGICNCETFWSDGSGWFCETCHPRQASAA